MTVIYTTGPRANTGRKMNLTDHANLTNQSTEPIEASGYTEPYGLRVFSLVLFSVIIFASLIGNALVLKAIIELPTRYKPFAYYLVANLAAAEIVSSLCQPFIMTYQEQYSWMFGGFACKLVIPLQVLAVIVVTSDLAAIAVYRYRAMITPVRKKVAGVVIAAIIGGMWLVALVVSLPLFVTRILVKLPSGHKVCRSRFPGNETYNIIRFTLCFVFPYIVMTCAYGAVTLKLKRHIRNNFVESPEFTTNSDDRREMHSLKPNKPRRRLHLEDKNRRGSKTVAELEYDLLRVIYVIIISFVVCYIPYQALFLWEYTTDAKGSWRLPFQEILRKYFYILTCLPGAIHPLCYGTMNRFFARAFSKIVMCRR